MRRFDKKANMERVNKLFEQRTLKESGFSWDGKYENEDIEEGLGDDMEIMEDEEDDSKTQWFSYEDGERLTDRNLDD